SRIPQFIIDDYLSLPTEELSPMAWKILIYLNRRATWDKSSNNYGRCFRTYEDIQKATGVKKSNMGKYMKQLESQGLIKHVQILKVEMVEDEQGKRKPRWPL
ncbi:MAG: helix-turn-helix domain-containing protein, partial [Pseudomonadota bacterium]